MSREVGETVDSKVLGVDDGLEAEFLKVGKDIVSGVVLILLGVDD